MILTKTDLDFDAIVIGAGISGLYQLYRLRELGMRVRVFERGTGVGGTWYWSRYPGARFDSESYTYAYSFSQELLDEWDWSEHFAGQPEILRYLQHVADKFDLRSDIRFSSEVKSAHYDEASRSWEVELRDGSRYRSRFLITGIGNLSYPVWPKIEGIEAFKGDAFHTARWPHMPVELEGKRVAVIGTGASGVQVIQTICERVGHLTVADKFDLRRDIQFSSEVKSAHYNDDGRCWEVELRHGSRYRSRFLITGIGNLSYPVWPKIEGIEAFKGDAFHTARWPHTPVELEGKRVAVIGTGASGVQVIQTICKRVGHLTVFQRRPNWCAPLNNGRIGPEEMEGIRAGYDAMFARCSETRAGFIHTADPRRTFEVEEKERYEFWEELYASRGFGIWQGNFSDILTDEKANKAISDFIADKIRGRVDDPVVAEKLIPKDHGFGTRRVPLEMHYFESYNRENVELIDITETPIERITEKGILTTEKEIEFDLIVFATGFDAIFGSFDMIDIRGVNQRRLKEQWHEELATFLGVQTINFPNMFMVMGPHAIQGNNPRNIEYKVEWITRVIKHMNERGYTRAEVGKDAQESWHDYVVEQGKGLLANKVDSWMTGVNSNLEGRQTRIVARYTGSMQAFRSRCEEVAAGGYRELNLK